jgi:hypothetical protein
VVLPGALLDADEELIIFVHERADQGLVVGGDAFGELRQGGFRRLAEMPGEFALPIFAQVARLLNRGALLLNRGDAYQDIIRGAAHDGLLLQVQARQHFTILLQFLAEGFNQGVKGISHSLESRKVEMVRQGLSPALIKGSAIDPI